ncbi:hypothetical protein BGZ65_008635, partial [Modicella reniformis]
PLRHQHHLRYLDGYFSRCRCCCSLPVLQQLAHCPVRLRQTHLDCHHRQDHWQFEGHPSRVL